jgi:hypothetical protein
MYQTSASSVNARRIWMLGSIGLLLFLLGERCFGDTEALPTFLVLVQGADLCVRTTGLRDLLG